ncbi:MAG TPA: class I SAM-dependent methyltransferase [bacterium]|nr:class I SAM-dependent methyltransferase [bacterium]
MGTTESNRNEGWHRLRFQLKYIIPLATRFRKKRLQFFKTLISRLPRPLTILDVGGNEFFWEQVGFTQSADVNILLLNLTKERVRYRNFTSIQGDARDMREFRNEQFDVVFSNSVIEHVGRYEQQCQMAGEIRRVGKRYWVQTPNRRFPVDPHFLIPFLQLYPMWLKTLATRYIDIGSFGKIYDRKLAENYFTNSHRLLSEHEVRVLFPGGQLYKEKLCGLTKSFVVYGGWNST